MADKELKREQLFQRYNKLALETGARLQGEFFLRLVEEFDELDASWTEGWLTWIYEGMYNRGVLDDKTRVFIVIGECCVLDEQVQLPNHIRSALRLGATAREILEVILQSDIYAGLPRMIKAVRTYRALMKDMGLVELTEPVFRGDARE